MYIHLFTVGLSSLKGGLLLLPVSLMVLVSVVNFSQ